MKRSQIANDSDRYSSRSVGSAMVLDSIIVRCFVRRLRDHFVLCAVSFYRSVTVTQFKLCFDVQRSKHSFVADRSDTNLIEDATMPCLCN